MTYIKALCVDHDSLDFGRVIKIEIPDGHIMLPPDEDDDFDRLHRQVQHLSEALDELRRAMERCK